MTPRAVVRSTQAALAAAWFGLLVGCGGRSVDLDQSSRPPSGAAGAVEVGSGVVQRNELKDRINDFWVDETRLYWSTSGSFSVQSCVYGDCAATLLTYGRGYGPVLRSGAYVFFLAGSSLRRCPVLGCTGAPEVYLQDTVDFIAPFLTTDERFLYWSSAFDSYRCPIENCGEIPEFVAKVRGAYSPLNLLGSNVYWWGPAETATLDSPETRIYTAPKDGSHPATELTLSGPNPASSIYDEPVLAVGSRGVYWLDSSYQIKHCPLDGCSNTPPATPVSTTAQKTQLWADAANLYWLESNGLSPENVVTGTIRFCPVSGCPMGVEPKALTSNRVRKFVLTQDYVYWNEPDTAVDDLFGVDKVIYRVEKPRFGP